MPWVIDSDLAGFNFKIEYLKGTDNKVANMLSHVEMRLDNATAKESLLDCPNTIIRGTWYTDKSKELEAWMKVQKKALNKVIKWAKFQHILLAKTDNPMLIAKHE